MLAGIAVSRIPTIRIDESRAVEAVDLFCGYGGATAGLIAAGLTVVAAYDLDPHAIRAHLTHHPLVNARQRDVAQVRPSELAGRIVWASPSCKPWSMANSTGQVGTSHPEYYPLSRLVEQAVLSRALVLENVPGLLFRPEGKAELERMSQVCYELSKPFQLLRLNASSFGLHQNRERVFIVAGYVAPLVVDTAPRGLASQLAPTVTTKSGDLAESSHLQNLTNPLELSMPEYRSGRRATGTPRKLVHVGRRLIGNAVPPVMAEAVVRAVLRALEI